MNKKKAAILIRDPDGIDTKLPLVERMHPCGYRFELFFIGFDPRRLSENDLARLTRLQEQGIVLFTDTPEEGLHRGFKRVDHHTIAEHLQDADVVIPL